MSERFSGERDFDSTNFFVFLLAWRIPILVISGLALIASVIFSSPFFITPKYKSTVILYPTSTNSVSKALLSDTYGGKEDILEFGEDEQTEQMLQILNSNKIRDRIVSKYDLITVIGEPGIIKLPLRFSGNGCITYNLCRSIGCHNQ